jgi:hypothetical protein
VNSRIELILKLGNTAGQVEAERLVHSTVDSKRGLADNRDRLISQVNWATSFRDTVSIIGKELEMKNLLNSKHVLVGVITALVIGVLWVFTLLYSHSLSLNDIKVWGLPLIFTLTIIGLAVGLIGKRNGNTLRRVFFSALFGTGLSPFLIIPLMIILVLPLGKLAEWFGLIDPSTMSSNVATMLTAAIMIAIWLVLGITIGIGLLFVTIQKADHAGVQSV